MGSDGTMDGLSAANVPEPGNAGQPQMSPKYVLTGQSRPIQYQPGGFNVLADGFISLSCGCVIEGH